MPRSVARGAIARSGTLLRVANRILRRELVSAGRQPLDAQQVPGRPPSGGRADHRATENAGEVAMKATIAVLVLVNWTMLASADNWPSWRGPTGLGVSEEKGLPVKWSTTENVRWKVALPAAGNSTPIIWGDRVFLTQASDLKQWPPRVPANYAGGASAGGHAIAEKRSVMCFR